MTETVLSKKDSLKLIADRSKNLLFPLRCPVCDRPAWPAKEGICLTCLKKLKPLTVSVCEKCGKKMLGNDISGQWHSGGSAICSDCKTRPRHFIRCRSVFEYAGAKEMIYRFKYAGRREYAEVFATLSEKFIGDYIYGNEFDCIVAVPVSKQRLLKRGYNQAEEYGRQLSNVTGIPFCGDAIRRVKNTSPLKLLNPAERQNNLKNAFKTGENVVKSKCILLVDDIYTTGATMDECARVLLGGGAKCVYGLTLSSGTGI